MIGTRDSHAIISNHSDLSTVKNAFVIRGAITYDEFSPRLFDIFAKQTNYKTPKI